MSWDWYDATDEEIRNAKLENLRARLRGCAALAKELDLDDEEILIQRAIAVLTPVCGGE